jgi:hypothetical protein
MHAATPSSKRRPSEAAARPTSRERRTAAPASKKARGVLRDFEAAHGTLSSVAGFPDKKATVAEVAKWLRTGELPGRLSC